MNKEKLQKILDDHKKWLNDKDGGVRADLRGAYLRYADLRGADLRYADLSGAYLRDANLRYADLRYANLSNANLSNADLSNADLRYADLCYANLSGADLRDANLSGADLRDANLRGADLRDANLRGADLDAEIFCLDRIGSRKGRTVYDATNDRVWCGCFKGTFAEWCAKIKVSYPDKKSHYRREYDAAIKYFRELAKIAKCEAALKGGVCE